MEKGFIVLYAWPHKIKLSLNIKKSGSGSGVHVTTLISACDGRYFLPGEGLNSKADLHYYRVQCIIGFSFIPHYLNKSFGKIRKRKIYIVGEMANSPKWAVKNVS